MSGVQAVRAANRLDRLRRARRPLPMDAVHELDTYLESVRSRLNDADVVNTVVEGAIADAERYLETKCLYCGAAVTRDPDRCVMLPTRGVTRYAHNDCHAKRGN